MPFERGTGEACQSQPWLPSLIMQTCKKDAWESETGVLQTSRAVDTLLGKPRLYISHVRALVVVV